MSDGSSAQEGSLVDDELCGDQEPSVDGDTNIVLQEACTVPCPGETASIIALIVSILVSDWSSSGFQASAT